VARFAGAVIGLGVLLATLACDRILPQRADLTLPPIATIDSIYRANGVRPDSIRYDGNVVSLVATQPLDQLQRGGSLWARVGPHIYLFNPATRALFETFEGIAAVRAVTRTPQSVEIGRAQLLRNTLNEASWPRALRLLSVALNEGTERPGTMQELARFGENNTEHSYNPEYVPNR
jgi:hypothetical protein